MVRSYFLKGLRYIDERYGNSWWDLEICTQILRSSRKVLLVPSARVSMGAEGQTTDWSAGVRALMAADRASGAAVWCSKHYGWFPGLKFRLTAMGRALVSLFALKDTACRFAILRHVLSGQKLDGSL
jgi:GT2 family glycosyltransferase